MDPFFVTFFLPFIQNVIYDCAKYLFLKGVNNVKNQNKFKNAIKTSVSNTTEKLDDKTQKEIVKGICADCKNVVHTDIEGIVSQVFKQNQVGGIDPQSVSSQIYSNIFRAIEKIPELNDEVLNKKLDEIAEKLEGLDSRSKIQHNELLSFINLVLENQTLENKRLQSIEKLLKEFISKSEQKNEKEKQQPSISANELDKYYFILICQFILGV